jgi:hypothetical protein
MPDRDSKTLWSELAKPLRPGETVRQRLDAVVPGEWDLTLEVLPPSVVGFKARLQILGVIREMAAIGNDYPHAAVKAFFGAARLFGVEVRAPDATTRHETPKPGPVAEALPKNEPALPPRQEPPVRAEADDEEECPKCGGRMWDNRATKRNPKAPDFKCRDRSCDGVIWPPRANEARPGGRPNSQERGETDRELTGDVPYFPEPDHVPAFVGTDDIPF